MKCTFACDCAGKEANFVYLNTTRVRWARDWGRLIDFVWINVWGRGVAAGGLLLDVYVRLEIIDFLLPRIKQKCEKMS